MLTQTPSVQCLQVDCAMQKMGHFSLSVSLADIDAIKAATTASIKGTCIVVRM